MKRIRFWSTVVLVVMILILVGPQASLLCGDMYKSTAMAFDTGGPLHLGYDYLGRPIAPQLCLGGRALLLAAVLSALCAQFVGLLVGLWLALNARGSKLTRLLLDALMVLPVTVVALVAFTNAGSSLYAIIPIATALSVPFYSRYYQTNAVALMQSAFYEQAIVAGDHPLQAAFREIVPVLLKPIVTDFGLSFITSVYLLSTVSFLGAGSADQVVLWPTMAAKNLPGIGLNPWAVLAPVLAITGLTLPLNALIEALGRSHE